jgi:hypothetical protein
LKTIPENYFEDLNGSRSFDIMVFMKLSYIKISGKKPLVAFRNASALLFLPLGWLPRISGIPSTVRIIEKDSLRSNFELSNEGYL